VKTRSGYRRRGFGRSVVAGMVNYLLQSGRQPLYVVSADNDASKQLAARIGFKDSGMREVMIQGVVRPRP
jgi:predicted GNAT family acetyltransferase